MAKNLTDNLYAFSLPARTIPVVEKGLKPSVLYVSGQKEQCSVAAENSSISHVLHSHPWKLTVHWGIVGLA